MLVEFEQNRMVLTIRNFELFGKKKKKKKKKTRMVDPFWQSVDAILEDVPVTEILIVWY